MDKVLFERNYTVHYERYDSDKAIDSMLYRAIVKCTDNLIVNPGAVDAFGPTRDKAIAAAFVKWSDKIKIMIDEYNDELEEDDAA